MIKKLEKVFAKLAYDRTEEIHHNLNAKNTKYASLSEKSIDLFYEIQNMLPDGSQHLIYDYKNTMSYLHGLSESCIYHQGLKDGIKLCQLLNFHNHRKKHKRHLLW